MRVSLGLLLALLASQLHAELSYKVENSNFTLSQGAKLYNYDRLRFRGDYTKSTFFATAIVDGINYYGKDFIASNKFSFIKRSHSDTPFATQTTFHTKNNTSSYAKLYRAYGGYEDDTNRVLVGVQNITMGVGRIWTPTNLFNPKNSYALEPDETYGVFALSYTRYISDTSHVTLVASKKADQSYKYALRYKAYLAYGDFAFDVIRSDTTTMLGYELEADLAQTGIEVRSEGAYIKSSLKKSLLSNEDVAFTEAIVGADYGFVNGLTLVAEALYASKKFSYEKVLLNYDSQIAPNLTTSHFYTALSLSYDFTIYLNGSLLCIESFDKQEGEFIAPNLSYTPNDYNTFSVGTMLQKREDTYYLKWVLSF